MRSAVVLALLLGAVCALVSVQAQEQPRQKPAEEQKTAGRLPPFYDVVVTPEQRQRIYAIQRKYQKQIEALQKQIEQLRRRRDQEIEAVLDEEQREIVARLRALAQRQKAQRKQKTPAEQRQP